MKKLFISIFIYFLINAIVFLAISFYNVSIDISTWTEFSRYTFSVLGMCMGLVVSGAFYFLND